MSFEEAIADLAAKIRTQSSSIQTEEATKNAFIMPFISRVLGYDVFNPLEVVPEFTADHGTKKGEKVDYAIMKEGEVQILIECKRIGDGLDIKHASQLFRYFSVTNARIGVLTNGQVFNFYTDLDAPNIMDERPFLVLDMLDIDETTLPELKKLTKETFNLDSVISSAEELKYVGALKRQVAEEFRDPSPEWVKLLMGRVSDRRGTVDNIRQFTELTEKATRQFLKEQVNARLKTALGDTEPAVPDVADAAGAEAPGTSGEAPETEAPVKGDVVTTEEELAGYQVVKAIACSEVKPQRVTQRDSKSYFAVLLDDNNRRTIARLWFNGKNTKHIGLFDENKVETRHRIEDVDDIYAHAETIRETVRRFTA
ncbi:type I restriction enzyme HsdR N-terminal domain-containing protein [Brachybacterium sp. MASK1Z-5]|uniref:Type I restriction enzyme HsdR N-terminal domain-containing protein n=1 Tax=Brachybacterium halotolerans TaxID=2795215 RepID=A0ABS1B9V1_9MICO|nr:type I restriction endonuclease [Brachybacterium halotolerans]MBK0331444.1 type I restriction enzyme HsdR N-terminal domain-containing protein [Brachybacterium halotolerans]